MTLMRLDPEMHRYKEPVWIAPASRGSNYRLALASGIISLFLSVEGEAERGGFKNTYV